VSPAGVTAPAGCGVAWIDRFGQVVAELAAEYGVMDKNEATHPVHGSEWAAETSEAADAVTPFRVSV